VRIRNLLFSTAFLAFVGAATAAQAAGAPGSTFTLSAPAHVPGATLAPGEYSIQVIGQLSDRTVLRVDSASGNVHSEFIGIPSAIAAKATPSGIVSWPNSDDGSQYLRGWVQPGTASVVEFVYPKAEAISLAKSNSAKVPAVDPASEGRVAVPDMSDGDRKLVTLWLLSATHVGPDSTAAPEIKAERYHTASYVHPKPVVKALPHTASLLPMFWIVSLLSILAASILRNRRTRRPAQIA
jgi:hypothetical protein